MSGESTCVQKTSYRDFFEDVRENTIFLLSPNESEKIWKHEINTCSSSYFDLPDDCWIITSESVPIGRWIEAYNSNDNIYVEQLIRASIDWQDGIHIVFFAKKNCAFRVKWKDFIKHWDDFIALHDDCPIISPENNLKKEALIFRPIGDILKIG